MRNKLIGFGLIVTIISAFQTPTLADQNIATGSNISTLNIANLTPVDLVNLAYQGRFGHLDIPSHGMFYSAVRTNKVDSQLLVESAIKSGRLDREKINDSAYLNQVQSLLKLKLRGD